MTRTVLTAGRIFDGTGSDPAFADVAIEDGRIVGLGTGLVGDLEIEVRDRTILPGMFDCHTHVCISNVDLWGAVQQPFSRQFYEAVVGRAIAVDRPHNVGMDGPRPTGHLRRPRRRSRSRSNSRIPRSPDGGAASKAQV